MPSLGRGDDDHGPNDDSNEKLFIVLRTLLCGAAIFLLAGPALAQVDPWEFDVYRYETLGRGIIDLESLNSVVASGFLGDPQPEV